MSFIPSLLPPPSSFIFAGTNMTDDTVRNWNGYIEEIDSGVVYVALTEIGASAPTHGLEVPYARFLEVFEGGAEDVVLGLCLNVTLDPETDLRITIQPGDNSAQIAQGLKSLFHASDTALGRDALMAGEPLDETKSEHWQKGWWSAYDADMLGTRPKTFEGWVEEIDRLILRAS